MTNAAHTANTGSGSTEMPTSSMLTRQGTCGAGVRIATNVNNDISLKWAYLWELKAWLRWAYLPPNKLPESAGMYYKTRSCAFRRRIVLLCPLLMRVSMSLAWSLGSPLKRELSSVRVLCF